MPGKVCERCGTQFLCGASTGECWCMGIPVVPAVSDAFKDCLCSNCLLAESKSPSNQKKLVENEDFYYENGFMVFTAKFLLARGYCCNSNCRHCPYKKSL